MLKHAAQGSEDVSRDETDAKRFGTRRVTNEAYNRQQVGRFRSGQRGTPHLARTQKSPALPPVVPHLKIVHAFAANLDHVALP